MKQGLAKPTALKKVGPTGQDKFLLAQLGPDEREYVHQGDI